MITQTDGRPNPPWKATVLRRSRSTLGVVLVEILLALAGLAGIAALLQSKQILPNEVDFKKALDKLSGNLLDPDANTTVGKYLAFVKGDYASAMPYLVHSQDKTLKSLAEHELDPVFTDNPEKKVGMADEWVAAAKKFPQLTTTFYDRASQWYVKAWPDLSDLWKMKAREQAKKIASARPIGAPRKQMPSGWVLDGGIDGNPTEPDGTTSRTGSYSIKVPPGKKENPGSASAFRSVLMPVSGDVEISAYVRSDGTENGADSINFIMFDPAGGFSLRSVYIPLDTPFWNRVTLKLVVPKNVSRAQLHAANHSKGGNIWVDDVSIKVDGKEVLKNGSFEDR